MKEEEVDKHIDTFGEMLKVHIKQFMYEQPRVNGHLRLSAIGKPDRQLWYDINTPVSESSLKPSTRIKFLYGYILEEGSGRLEWLSSFSTTKSPCKVSRKS